MNLYYYFECPHCGHKNVGSQATDTYEIDKVGYCEEEDGGCGEMFVLQFPIQVDISDKVTVREVKK